MDRVSERCIKQKECVYGTCDKFLSLLIREKCLVHLRVVARQPHPRVMLGSPLSSCSATSSESYDWLTCDQLLGLLIRKLTCEQLLCLLIRELLAESGEQMAQLSTCDQAVSVLKTFTLLSRNGSVESSALRSVGP